MGNQATHSEKETAVFMAAAGLYVIIAACVFLAIGFWVVLGPS